MRCLAVLLIASLAVPAFAASPTPTPTKTPRPVATERVARAALTHLAPSLDPIASPIVVGDANTLTGSGFTAGSVIRLFVATSSGAQAYGPFTPTAITPTQLNYDIPASVLLGNGFGTVLVINTDQGFVESNAQSQLLNGSHNIPTILKINGVALSPLDPTIPVANVETVVAPGQTVVIDGLNYNVPRVNLYTAAGNVGPLFATWWTRSLSVTVPAGAPTGPGSFQIVNDPFLTGELSNAVAVVIGATLSITSIDQSGSTVTVHGTGFSTLSVINLFAQKTGGGVDNFGGLNGSGQAKIPLNVSSSTLLSFSVPSGSASGPAYIMVLNPPFIPYASSGVGPSGAFTLAVP
jgi:hypothetical protein